MKKVLIVGLGLMGGSILKALPSDKYTVLGADLKREAEKEVSLFWDMESETDADIVLLCISPLATERFLKDKLHLLLGLAKILLDIDKAIRIIRQTEKEDDVVPNLMKGFGIDEVLANYIAEIKL